jgi:hypothetical protein
MKSILSFSMTLVTLINPELYRFHYVQITFVFSRAYVYALFLETYNDINSLLPGQ